MFKEVFDNLFSKTSIEVLTAFATTGATFFAWKTTQLNKEQMGEQIDEQHRVERPRLTPLNLDIYRLGTNLYGDWIMHTTYENYKGFSNANKIHNSPIAFNLINTGRSFAVKVSVHFEIVDGINSVIQREDSEIKIIFSNPLLKQSNPPLFEFKLFDSVTNNTIKENIKVLPHYQRVDMIKSNEASKVLLPKFFIVLTNMYFKGVIQQKPKLKIGIKYTDQYNKTHEDTYYAYVKREKFAEDYNVFWLNFDFISTK